MKEPLVFLLMGRAGCGKGTQANLLVKYLEKNNLGKPLYVYVGNNLRKFIKENSSLTSKLAGKIMEKGDMEPSLLSVWALAADFIEKLDRETSLVIDGFPRNLTEAEIIDEAISFYELKKAYPIFIETSREWSKNKLLERQREDDTEQAIKRRLDYFEEFVVPTIKYYAGKSKYKLITVNGEQGVEDVHKEIIKKVFNGNYC